MKKITKKDESKLYFEVGGRMCYKLNHFKSRLCNNEFKDGVEVFTAKRVLKNDIFWCQEYGAPAGKGDGVCGKDCDFYKPVNGKNGICKSNKHLYESGEKRTLIQIKDNFYWK